MCDVRCCFLVISLLCVIFPTNNVPDIPAEVTGQPRPEYKTGDCPIFLTLREQTNKECHIHKSNINININTITHF